MAQRVYKTATIYNARIIGLRNLWEPSKEYMGKPVDRPAFLTSVIIPKTRAQWFEEPPLADLMKACQELYSAVLSHIPFAQITWPVQDGDVPDPGKDPVEWKKGHWFLPASSTLPVSVLINRGGVLVPLEQREGVKAGDYVALGISVSVNANDARKVKCFLNKIAFMAPGEEIAIGTSASNSEMMERAKAQGMNVTGFGAGGPPSSQGFGQGFAPPPASPVSSPAPAQFNPLATGNASFPSNGLAPAPAQPPVQQGFGLGFPQR